VALFAIEALVDRPRRCPHRNAEQLDVLAALLRWLGNPGLRLSQQWGNLR